MDSARLAEDLRRDEGLCLKPYRDTVGKLTIGIGRNLDDVGISEREAFILLDSDIGRVLHDLDTHAPWWRNMSEARMRGLANMCFNLGWPRLSTFKKMLAALEAGDYATARLEALDSRWAQQVKSRAVRIAGLFHEVQGR